MAGDPSTTTVGLGLAKLETTVPMEGTYIHTQQLVSTQHGKRTSRHHLGISYEHKVSIKEEQELYMYSRRLFLPMTPFCSMVAIVLMRAASICCIICSRKMQTEFTDDEILLTHMRAPT